MSPLTIIYKKFAPEDTNHTGSYQLTKEVAQDEPINLGRSNLPNNQNYTYAHNSEHTKLLAYSENRMLLVDLVENTAKELTFPSRGRILSPIFSKDGTKIIYLDYDHNPITYVINTEPLNLNIIDLNGKLLTQKSLGVTGHVGDTYTLLTQINDTTFTISEDSFKFAKNFLVDVFDMNTGALTEKINLPSRQAILDQQQLLFGNTEKTGDDACFKGADTEISLYDIDSNKIGTIQANNEMMYATLGFSPNYKKSLVVTSPRKSDKKECSEPNIYEYFAVSTDPSSPHTEKVDPLKTIQDWHIALTSNNYYTPLKSYLKDDPTVEIVSVY